MASRYLCDLHLESKRTPQWRARKVASIHLKLIYKSQGQPDTIREYPVAEFDFSPQILASHADCESIVFQELVDMGLDPFSCNDCAPRITSFAIDSASRYGNDVGFSVVAKVEVIFDEDGVPDPTDGGGMARAAIEWYNYNGHIMMIDGDVDHDAIPIQWYDPNYEGVIAMDEEDDSVIESRGASRSVIDKLKNERFEDDDEYLKGDLGTCPVCLEELLPKTALRMPCSHLFHDRCIVRWLERNDSCPMCRKATVCL